MIVNSNIRFRRGISGRPSHRSRASARCGRQLHRHRSVGAQVLVAETEQQDRRHWQDRTQLKTGCRFEPR